MRWRRAATGPGRAAVRPDRDCLLPHGMSAATAVARATLLLSGEIELPPHPPTPFVHPPDWTSDPLGQGNWRFQLHSLRWVQTLKRAYDGTGNADFLDRYLEILRDWQERHPVQPPSSDAWGRHATAVRARVYAACAEAIEGRRPGWLRHTLRQHVEVLADPEFYAQWGGNQALDQDVGLFAAAVVLGDAAAAALAVERTTDLVRRSVDGEGVTNEQSSEYQVFNYRRYVDTKRLLTAHGVALPEVFERIERMPEVIAYLTLPDGHDAMIGDATDAPSLSVPGTIAEYAATRGAAGPRPASAVRLFQRGYLVVRTGWGPEPIDEADDSHLVVRFGKRRVYHGHHDAASVAWYAGGQRVVLNAGKYAYTKDDFRDYVRSRRAQNTVCFPDAHFDPRGSSELLWLREGDVVVARIRDHHYPDVAFERTVAFELATATLVTVDWFASRTGQQVTAEQRFRLAPDLEVQTVEPRRVVAGAAPQPQIAVRQLGDGEVAVVRGQVEPYDGWVSLYYGEREPTSVIVTTQHADEGRFVTVLTCRPDTEALAAEVVFDAAADTLRFPSGRVAPLEP